MWILFAFASAGLLGLYDIFKKKALSGNAVIPTLFFNTLICFMLFLPLIVLSLIGEIAETSTFYVPFGGWKAQILIALKSMLVLSSWFFGYMAIKHLPLTIVASINATRPVFVLMGAVFLFHEQLNVWQWCGVLLAIFSLYMLSKSSRKEGINFRSDKWFYCLMAAALLGAFSGLYDKFLLTPTSSGGMGLNKMTVQSWYNLYQMLMMGMILYTIWLPKRKTMPFRWTYGIAGISVFLTLADFAYFYALSIPGSMIAIVSMVRRGSVIVSFAYGAFILKERNIKEKTFDLLLVILSMLFLYYGTT